MAVYKVPQDVEADDKLIGPFSFRQFIYLVIVVMAMGIAWGLSLLFIPLAVLPIPVIIFFGALALPLRKDQPMEIYMAAIVSFYLKPRRRLWESDGIESLIEITVPRIPEVIRTKDISQSEAEKRFSYLAEISDSQGWAVRGAGIQAPNSAMKSDMYFEAQQIPDVLDKDNTIAQSLNNKLDQSDALRRQELMKNIQNKTFPEAPMVTTPQPQQTPNLSSYFGGSPLTEQTTNTPDTTTIKPLVYNPYPVINQAVLQPMNQKKPASKTEETTSEKKVSTGIINLASNNDLSIATIAREANRIKEKQDMTEEVVIQLR